MRLRHYLNKKVTVTMDRPLGSVHPKYDDMIYPVNYGYIENTVSGDGDEIDVYIIGEQEPLAHFTGEIIAIIERSDDVEDKLVAARHTGYSDKEIMAAVDFTEAYFQSKLFRHYDMTKWTHDRLTMMHAHCKALSVELDLPIGYYDKNMIMRDNSFVTQEYSIPIITKKPIDIGFNIDHVFVEIFEVGHQVKKWCDLLQDKYTYELYHETTCEPLMLEDLGDETVGLSINITYYDYSQEKLLKLLKGCFHV